MLASFFEALMTVIVDIIVGVLHITGLVSKILFLNNYYENNNVILCNYYFNFEYAIDSINLMQTEASDYNPE